MENVEIRSAQLRGKIPLREDEGDVYCIVDGRNKKVILAIYQRFLDKGKRDTPYTREKLAVALGLLQLFQQHRQKLSNQEIVVSKK